MIRDQASNRAVRRMWLRRIGLSFLLLTAGLMLGARPPAPVNEQIDQLIQAEGGNLALWGIYVQDVNSGRVLYSHNADRMMLPASNQKLITTVGALDAFGGDYRYQTKLHFDGSVRGSELHGDLIIQGSGDPSFGSSKFTGEDPLRSWAYALAGMGVTRIEGRIIGDDDVFDNKPYAEGWDIDYLTSQSSRSLGISAGGLSYRDNVIALRVRSGRVGGPPVIDMQPPAYLDIRNQATTSNRSRGWALDIDRLFGTETLTLTGSLPRSYQGTVFMPITNPTTFTLHSFRQYLQNAGIEVDAALVDVDELDRTLSYDDAEPLFVHLSPPLSEILVALNKESNNFYAEQIFRSFSWGGSAAGGERRIKELLTRIGIDATTVSIRDGSGLSRKNLISPRALVRLLTYMHQHDERDVFKQSLARGGEPETTLRYRLSGMPVQAKTGSLEFVRTLSGYATTADRREVAFAVFANNYVVPPYRITQLIDRIVMTLTSSTAG